jgi:hypothetical protein
MMPPKGGSVCNLYSHVKGPKAIRDLANAMGGDWLDSGKGRQSRDQFTIPLKCKCGQTGSVVWEENSNIGAAGSETALITLSEGFYERIVKKDRRSIELVCHRCGATQPG